MLRLPELYGLTRGLRPEKRSTGAFKFERFPEAGKETRKYPEISSSQTDCIGVFFQAERAPPQIVKLQDLHESRYVKVQFKLTGAGREHQPIQPWIS